MTMSYDCEAHPDTSLLYSSTVHAPAEAVLAVQHGSDAPPSLLPESETRGNCEFVTQLWIPAISNFVTCCAVYPRAASCKGGCCVYVKT